MSTEGRSAMLPHASYVLAGLIKNGKVVYVHCNAGVGRSVAAVCGYLMYCVGLSFPQVQHTVAYFDKEALLAAEPRYKAMFGTPYDDLTAQRRALLEAASIPVAYDRVGGKSP